MKFFFLLALSATLLLAGCESLSTRVHERFSPVPPQTRIFAASLKVVYPAAQRAVKNAGLLLGHTSLARGSIDGYAPIRSGSAATNARQTTLEIRLTELGPDQTEVAVLVWDHTEGDFPGGTSEQAFRQHGLYETYFAGLQQLLQEDGAGKGEGKP